MASIECVHCLLCSVDLPVSSMWQQLECRQDLVAVWQTVTNGSGLLCKTREMLDSCKDHLQCQREMLEGLLYLLLLLH